MFLKLLLVINISLFAVIASQALFYLIALTKVQNRLSAAAYLESRQLINHTIAGRLKLVYYAAIATSMLLLRLTFDYYTGLLFFSVLIAFILLVADIMIALLGNQPINTAFNGFTINNLPSDWEKLKAKWNRYYAFRQVLAIAGTLTLLLGLLFEN